MHSDKIEKKYTGTITLTKDLVYISNKSIEISQILKLELVISDFSGKVNYRSDLDFRGMYSEGVANYFKIITKDNETFEANFLINSKEHKSDLIDFVAGAVENKLLGINRARKILGINQWDEILMKKLTAQIKRL